MSIKKQRSYIFLNLSCRRHGKVINEDKFVRYGSMELERFKIYRERYVRCIYRNVDLKLEFRCQYVVQGEKVAGYR